MALRAESVPEISELISMECLFNIILAIPPGHGFPNKSQHYQSNEKTQIYPLKLKGWLLRKNNSTVLSFNNDLFEDFESSLCHFSGFVCIIGCFIFRNCPELGETHL